MKTFLALLVLAFLAGCGGGGRPTQFRLGTYMHGSNQATSYLASRIVWTKAGVRPLRLPLFVTGQVRAPDGRRAVFGQVDGSFVLVDLVGRRVVRTLRPWGRPPVSCGAEPLLWRTADRLVAMLVCGDAHRVDVSSLATIDPGSGRVLRVTPIGIPLQPPARLAGGIALIITEPNASRAGRYPVLERLGRVQLFRVDGNGTVTTKTLLIRGGANEDQTVVVTPDLVLLGGSVYVLGEGTVVAEVDPQTLAVTYHRIPLPAQHALSGPKAPHQGTANPARIELRQGVADGECILVTGSDTWTNGHDDWSAPAGLRMVNVRTWASQLVDPRPAWIDRVKGRTVRAATSFVSDASRTITVAVPRASC